MGQLSTLNTITQAFLYMLPAGAGKVLQEQLTIMSATYSRAQQMKAMLQASSDELIRQVRDDGDEEDKLISLNVFLWRQSHGVIPVTARIECGFLKHPFVRYIHRYMAANGYERIAEQIPFQHKDSYAAEARRLLNEFARSRFEDSEDDGNGNQYWHLLSLLNVLGPQINNFDYLSEVVHFCDYLIYDYKSNPALNELHDDIDLSAFALLLMDLQIEPSKTWLVFKDLFLQSKNRTVVSYPALLAGLQMYGELMVVELPAVELQGGIDLFLRLAGR